MLNMEPHGALKSPETESVAKSCVVQLSGFLPSCCSTSVLELTALIDSFFISACLNAIHYITSSLNSTSSIKSFQSFVTRYVNFLLMTLSNSTPYNSFIIYLAMYVLGCLEARIVF